MRWLFYLTVLSAVFYLMVGHGIAFRGVDQTPEDAPEELTDSRIAVAIKQKLAGAGQKAFASIDVSVKDGVAILTGTADSLWTQHRARELPQFIRGVRGVIDRLSVGPVESKDDSAIKQHLEQMYVEDPVVERSDIHVTVTRGVVTLEGEVQSWQEKQSALNLAKMIKGVHEVRDALTVHVNLERSDSVLREEIAERLRFDVWVESPDALTVRVRDGWATIGGQVGNAFEKSRVEELAWIEGIRGVNARDVTVYPTMPDPMLRPHRPSLSNREIAESVQKVFSYDRRVSPFDIHVSVKNGIVTLQGQVPFLFIKRQVEQDAHHTVGVNGILNLIQVWSKTSLSDADIHARLNTVFSRDPILHTFAIEASVRDGAVLLTGTVDSIYERNHAENVASRVPGINSLLNEMVFSKPEAEKTDWEIQLDIENQIWWSPLLSEQDIVATVTDGKATLTGSVHHIHQRVMAEQQAYEAGAAEVINRLRVGSISSRSGTGEGRNNPDEIAELL